MLEEKITVLIPTYNRKQQLKHVLTSLEKQTNANFNIVISDNASDYDVNEILKELPFAFKKKCRIFRRKVNVGADFNIVDSFSLCDTKWAWTLSDDDYVLENAIDKIYDYINKIKYFGCINFTLASNMPIEEKKSHFIESIEDFIEFYLPSYERQSEWYGDLIFISNKVYDVELVRPYLQFAYKYIYTRVVTAPLYLKLLENGVPYVIIKDQIVKYNANNNRSWKIYEVVLASRTLLDVKFSVTHKEYKKILKCITFNIRYVYYLYFVECPEKENVPYFFEQIYHGIYKYFLSISEKIILKIISIITKKNAGYYLCKRLFSFYIKKRE